MPCPPLLKEGGNQVFGASPSGKALGFDPSMRRFESYRPSQIRTLSLCI